MSDQDREQRADQHGQVVTGVADRIPARLASRVYLDAFVGGDGARTDSAHGHSRLYVICPESWRIFGELRGRTRRSQRNVPS